jgi:hypothetical protein
MAGGAPDLVAQTIAQWRRQSFELSRHDCMMSCARYFDAITGNDIAEEFAGTYADMDEAKDIVQRHGGHSALMAYIGGTEVDGPPQRGDIVCIEANEDEIIPALCTGEAVIMLLERGVIELDMRFIRVRGVWRGIP